MRDLAARQLVSRKLLDDARHAVAEAQAQRDAAIAAQSQAAAMLGGSAGTPTDRLPEYRAALAAVEKARLDLAHAEVYAPEAGIVGTHDLQVGEYLGVGQTAMPLVATAGVWIEANFKETDLTKMRVGQHASFRPRPRRPTCIERRMTRGWAGGAAARPRRRRLPAAAATESAHSRVRAGGGTAAAPGGRAMTLPLSWTSMRFMRRLAAATLALPGCGGDPPTQRQDAPIAVTTTTLRPVAWRDSIEALGTAQANESVTLTAKVSETVRKVGFENGDYVEVGQLLVDLSGNTQLAALEEAAAAYREAQRLFERQQDLASKQLIAASAFDTQRAARDSARARMDQVRAQLGDRAITAPFAGVLGLRQVSPGTLVTPGTPIVTLDDVSIIKLDFSVPETYLSLLAPGQAVSAGSAAFPGRSFEGRVATVDSRVDPVTRAIKVRALVPNPQRLLRPGMLMTVELFQPGRQALAVPEIAIVQVGQASFLYRVKPDGSVEQVQVRLGARRRGEVEILPAEGGGGIRAGERVVVDGTVKLRDGVRIAEAGAGPAKDARTAAGDAPARRAAPEG